MDTKKLRQKILDLAIRGKLVPQDPNDEPASVLLERIKEEKERLIKEGKIKRDKKEKTSDTSPYQNYELKITNYELGEKPFEVPESWVWASGLECFNPMESRKPTGVKFRYIDINSIDNKKHTISEARQLYVSEAPSRASRSVDIGDTLFSMVRPYLENIAYVDENYHNCIASTGFFVCKPQRVLHSKYLYYLMLSSYVIDGLNVFMKGDNSPSINNDNITSFLYPIPPLNEQKRIITIIESAFSLVDEIEANQQGLTQFIKQAKFKVLDLAIRGKLVPQDPNDEPASELLERIKKEQNATKSSADTLHYNQPFEIPESWEWVTISQISESISAGGDKPLIFSSIKTNECTVPIYSNAITNKGLYGYTNMAIITKPSITISARGTIGYSCIRYESFCPIIRLISITPRKIINIEYLYRALCYLIPQGEGSSIPQLTVPAINPKKIPLPPLSEQKRIVSKIEDIFSQLDTIEKALKA